MADTFAQMEEREIGSATGISAERAVKELGENAEILLVDVRDTAEMEATGVGYNAVMAPGRSIAWMADLESEYRSAKLQDRSCRIFTTCGGAPSYRGAAAANVLTSMGFENVAFVDGGMAALMKAGLETKPPK